MSARSNRSHKGCGCFTLGVFGLALGLLAVPYFFAPLRTNVLLLGIDYVPAQHSIARSDTIVLVSIVPTIPDIQALSIPRDLWLPIPGVGENRINTAHFFAEAQAAGSGPQAVMNTIRQNFGVETDYHVRVRFEGVRDIVDVMGGVDITLSQPMAGYPAGNHHLTGSKALAFARSRIGSDDFFRMEQGQILMKAILKQLIRPRSWPRFPWIVAALLRNIDTSIPWWQWPRLGLAFVRAGPDGINSRMVDRSMAVPFTTSEGASVLLPNWELIRPLIRDMFGE